MIDDQEKDFYEIATEEHKIRERDELNDSLNRKLTGECEYTMFCLWCNAFNKGQGKSNSEIFAKYLKEENIKLTFWQKKHLAEKYFGFEYEWDCSSNKWIIKKKSA